MPESGSGRGGHLRRLLYRLRFVGAASVGAPLFVGLSSLALFRLAVLKWDRDRVTRRWIDRWWKVMSAVLGWEVEVENRETLTRTRPVVFVGNHQSNLDTVVWAKFYPDATVVVGKQEIRRIPVFGWLFRATNNILIDRANPDKARSSLKAAAERVRSERLNVWMAPEGHRNQGPEMLPFKKGPFRLAIAAKVPLVPFVVGPVWTLLDAKRWLVRSGQIRVKVLEPVSTADLTEENADALLLKVRAQMEAARNALIAAAGPRIS